MISFPQALKICIIKKPFNWKDRASRSEFWWFFLFINLFSILISPLAEQYKVMNIIMGVSSIPLLWLHTMVSIRRLHDLNKSAWWLFAPYLYLLLAIIILALTVDPWADEKSPVHIVLILGVFAVLIYFLVLLCLFCKRGTVGANRFGPDPLELDLLSTHNQFAQYNQSQQHIKPTKRDSSQVEKGFNPTNNGFNPNQQGFNPADNGFNPAQQGFNPANNGFNPAQQGFNPTNNGFNPAQQGFNPANNGFNHNQQGFNPADNGFNPAQQGFNPNNNGEDSK